MNRAGRTPPLVIAAQSAWAEVESLRREARSALEFVGTPAPSIVGHPETGDKTSFEEH